MLDVKEPADVLLDLTRVDAGRADARAGLAGGLLRGVLIASSSERQSPYPSPPVSSRLAMVPSFRVHARQFEQVTCQ